MIGAPVKEFLLSKEIFTGHKGLLVHCHPQLLLLMFKEFLFVIVSQYSPG
jgi:hypothetical protein